MKKIFIIILFALITTSNGYSAGGSGGDGADNKQSIYKSAVSYVKAGKKLEKKGKVEKAYEKVSVKTHAKDVLAEL